MKRYRIKLFDSTQFNQMVEHPSGEWIKWEDVKGLLTSQEIETLDDIIGMYRQEFGASDYRYEEAEKVIDKLRGRI